MICIIKALQQVEDISVVDEGLAKGDGFYFEKFDPTTNQKFHFRTSIIRKSKNIFKVYCK